MPHEDSGFDSDGQHVPTVDFDYPDEGAQVESENRENAVAILHLLECIVQRDGELLPPAEVGKRAIRLAYSLRTDSLREMSQRELASHLGEHESYTSRHLARIKRDGLGKPTRS